MEPAVLEVRQRHADGVTDLVQAREDVALLVGALLDKILSLRHKYEIGYFLLREQMQPTAAMDILYDELIEPVHELMARLVGPLRGKPATDPDVIIEVQALYGEAIVFWRAPDHPDPAAGVEALDEDHLARIGRVVRETLLRPVSPVAGNRRRGNFPSPRQSYPVVRQRLASAGPYHHNRRLPDPGRSEESA